MSVQEGKCIGTHRAGDGVVGGLDAKGHLDQSFWMSLDLNELDILSYQAQLSSHSSCELPS